MITVHKGAVRGLFHSEWQSSFGDKDEVSLDEFVAIRDYWTQPVIVSLLAERDPWLCFVLALAIAQESMFLVESRHRPGVTPLFDRLAGLRDATGDVALQLCRDAYDPSCLGIAEHYIGEKDQSYTTGSWDAVRVISTTAGVAAAIHGLLGHPWGGERVNAVNGWTLDVIRSHHNAVSGHAKTPAVTCDCREAVRWHLDLSLRLLKGWNGCPDQADQKISTCDIHIVDASTNQEI